MEVLMRRFISVIIIIIFLVIIFYDWENPEHRSFLDDLQFLEKYTETVVLNSPDGEGVAVVTPGMQGRVMTSSAAGHEGTSFGWINREFIESGKSDPHVNPFGGEDRFWLGPEGGQYSIFFEQGVPFDMHHWTAPGPIDREDYAIAEQGNDFITFNKEMNVSNYSGFEFQLLLNRRIEMLNSDTLAARYEYQIPRHAEWVAFESRNIITNTGNEPWAKETGLLSIWILGMFNPSPTATVVVPFKQGPASELGPKVKDDYFGEVPQERLKVKEGILFFRGDGRYKSKIGISPQRAKNFFGSYDPDRNVLTLITFNRPEGETDYVNSMWEIQEDPFSGDVINSYNDGPGESGELMGPFYELETSSPAADLDVGESITHVHTTLHLQGKKETLDEIARDVLGAGLEEIVNALP